MLEFQIMGLFLVKGEIKLKVEGKWVFASNLQTMQQNAIILKLFSKMPIFFKLDFNKIEFGVKLDILKIEFYVYF